MATVVYKPTLTVNSSPFADSSVETETAEDPAALSLPALVDVHMDCGDDVVAGVSTDDVSENHMPKRVIPDSLELVDLENCSDVHAGGEDGTDAHLARSRH